jgi:cysteine-rich repeat protein
MYKFILVLCFLLVGCPRAVCGDGVLEKGEACDDANLTNADGCEADCSLPACNNGIVDPNEVCFFAPLTFVTDTGPTNVVSSDLNEDGSLDIVTANFAGESLGVLLGDGAGGFSRLPDIEFDSFASFVAVADFDLDGVLDLAVALADVNRVDVLRGLGDGTFEPLTTISVSLFSSNELIVGDFSENGAPDLMIESEDGIELHLNNGSGGFLPPRFFLTENPIIFFDSGDFNGDNNLDVVVTQDAVEGGVQTLLGDGLGNFAIQPLVPTNGGPLSLLAGNFDTDNVLDLVTVFSSSEMGILIGNGDGLFSESKRFPFFAARDLASGDINNDEFLDVAVAVDVNSDLVSHLGLLLGDGAGGFEVLPLLPAGNVNVGNVALADFNADGALDAVLTYPIDAQVVVFLSEP